MGVKASKKSQKASLVKRAKKLPPTEVKHLLSNILGATGQEGEDESCVASTRASTAATGTLGFLSKVRPSSRMSVSGLSNASSGTKSKPIEIVGPDGRKVLSGTAEVTNTVSRTTAEAQGLKLLHRAVKNQNHLKLLPHQEHGDFEFKLRRVATLGIVQLFNSIKAAQKIGEKEMEDTTITIDKSQEKKLVASRDAFLEALRAPLKQTEM
eukprot:Tbor_TRINITY_DN5826_c1_g1::TRINITY_DN5826_c1_g1_i1::g.6083::m.6083